MFKREDLVDWVMERLAAGSRAGGGAPAAPAAPAPPPAGPAPEAAARRAEPGPRGRLFLTEHEIRRRLTGGGKELRIPRNAIVSPLAQDWLVLAGVRVIIDEP